MGATRKSATIATFSRCNSYSYTLGSIDDSVPGVKSAHGPKYGYILCINGKAPVSRQRTL